MNNSCRGKTCLFEQTVIILLHSKLGDTWRIQALVPIDYKDSGSSILEWGSITLAGPEIDISKMNDTSSPRILY